MNRLLIPVLLGIAFLAASTLILSLTWQVARDADLAAERRLEQLLRQNLQQHLRPKPVHFVEQQLGDNPAENWRNLLDHGALLTFASGSDRIAYPLPDAKRVTPEETVRKIQENPENAAEIALENQNAADFWPAALLALQTQPDNTTKLANALRNSLLTTDREIPTSQRAFFLDQLQQHIPEDHQVRTRLEIERIASLEIPLDRASTNLQPLTLASDVHQLSLPTHNAILLLSHNLLRNLILNPDTPTNIRIETWNNASPSIRIPVGDWAPGYFIATSLDRALLPNTARNHLLIGSLTILLLAIILAVSGWLMVRNQRLASLRNSLAATVSHEIKTPLASIRLLTDTLLEDDEITPNQQQEALQRISRENVRLTRLIDQFLNFSRMAHGPATFETETLRPEKILQTAIQSVPALKDATLSQTISENLPEITGSADALTTAIVNLLENACKHTPAPPEIEITLTNTETHIQLVIQDHGPGIPQRLHNRIFQPFYQVNQKLSRPAEGCGLGLSIVKWIIDAHHGTVTLTNAPTGGARFEIQLKQNSQMDTDPA